MEAVAPDHELGVDAVVDAVLRERDRRTVRGDVVERDVLDLVVRLDAGGIVRGVEVLLDLGLPVRHELGAGVLADVEVEEVRAAVGDAGLRVDVALGVHPLADAGAAQHLDRAPLEHAGADARQHVLAALAFDDDALDARLVQNQRQQRSGGPRPDDRDPSGQRVPHGASALSKPIRPAQLMTRWLI